MSFYHPFINGSAYVTNGLISTNNSNTLGNLYTTGGNVGINTSAPSTSLDISGSARISAGLSAGNINATGVTAGNINFTGNLYQNGVLYTASGASSQWTTNGSGVTYTSGNVGATFVSASNMTATGATIGTLYASTIKGALTSNPLYIKNMDDNNHILQYTGGSMDGVALKGYAGGVLAYQVGGYTPALAWVYNVAGPRVGINTTSPGYTFDANGTVAAIAYTGGNVQISGTVSAANLVGALVSAASIGVAGATFGSVIATNASIGTLRLSNTYGIDFASNIGNQQIAFADLPNNFFGIGANNSAMQYQAGLNSVHRFYTNASRGTADGALGTLIASITSTGISTSNAQMTGTLSAGNLVGSLVSSGSMGAAGITTGTLYASNITVGNLYVSGYTVSMNMTTLNMIDTNVTAGSIVAGNITVGNVSASNVNASIISTGTLVSTNISSTSLISSSITASNLLLNTTNDVPAINPDAFNTLIVYEDMQGTSLRSGTLIGDATFDATNDYVQLTPATDSKNGTYYWGINPGNSFSLDFELYVGGGTGADYTTFYWNSSGYSVVFDEYVSSANRGISVRHNNNILSRLNDITWADSTWHKIRLVFFRNQFRVYVDNSLKINYLDTTTRTLSGNVMGFNSSTGSENNYHRIRNIRISKFTEGLWSYQGQTSPNIMFNGGNVGVNTITPGYTLDVGGDINFTGSLRQNNSLYTVALPPGFIIQYTSSSAPNGWLSCDGSEVSRTTYSALFVIISTTYGSGNGSTTFNLPDLRGRVAVGAGQGSGLTNRITGSSGGAETHTLTISEMPSHKHDDSGHNHAVPGGKRSGRGGYPNMDDSESDLNTHIGYANIQHTGGGGAHNNMQPFIVINFVIKT